MVLASAIKTTNNGGGKSQEEVSFASNSLAKLKAGFNAGQAYNQRLTERWKEKEAKAPKVLRCNGKGTTGKGCRQIFKNISGIKAHWRSKKNQCCQKDGYEKIADVQITEDDRITPEQKRILEMQTRGEAAARQAHAEVYGKKHETQETANAKKLMTCPISQMPALLTKADEGEIGKLLDNQFQAHNATRKYLAQREIDRRGR